MQLEAPDGKPLIYIFNIPRSQSITIYTLLNGALINCGLQTRDFFFFFFFFYLKTAQEKN